MSPGRACSSAISMARSRSGSISTFAEVRCRPTMRVVDDQQRIFAARIVAREHHHVAHAARSFAHQRTLGCDRDRRRSQTSVMMRPLGSQFARRRQQIAQRIVGVRVVHHHQKWLPKIDALEAARHRRQFGDARFDGLARKAQGDARGDRRQQVVNVDAPDQARVHFDLASGRFGGEFQPQR